MKLKTTIIVLICTASIISGVAIGYLIDNLNSKDSVSVKTVPKVHAVPYAEKFKGVPTIKSILGGKSPEIAYRTFSHYTKKQLENTYGKIIIYKAHIKDKQIALTFDDGPDKSNTLSVLNILKNNKVKGNFFFIGNKINRYKSQVKRAFDEGHLVLNHTFSHKDMKKLTAKQLLSEISTTQNKIKAIIGKKPLFLRPPYGLYNNLALYAAMKTDSRIINWNVDTRDFSKKTTKNDIINTTLRGAKPGTIILMHTGGKNYETLKALPEIIRILKSKGFKFETLDNLLNMPAYE